MKYEILSIGFPIIIKFYYENRGLTLLGVKSNSLNGIEIGKVIINKIGLVHFQDGFSDISIDAIEEISKIIKIEFKKAKRKIVKEKIRDFFECI